MSKAIELSYQASHLNSKYGLRGMDPAQIRLQGAIFGRLGMSDIRDNLCTYTTVL